MPSLGKRVREEKRVLLCFQAQGPRRRNWKDEEKILKGNLTQQKNAYLLGSPWIFFFLDHTMPLMHQAVWTEVAVLEETRAIFPPCCISNGNGLFGKRSLCQIRQNVQLYQGSLPVTGALQMCFDCMYWSKLAAWVQGPSRSYVITLSSCRCLWLAGKSKLHVRKLQ